MDALTQRDLLRLIEVSDPEVEWHSIFAALGEGGVYRGRDGLRRWLSDLDDAWEIARVDLDDAIGVGDVVVLVGRLHYRGRGSGVESEAPTGWLFEFRDARCATGAPSENPSRRSRRWAGSRGWRKRMSR